MLCIMGAGIYRFALIFFYGIIELFTNNIRTWNNVIEKYWTNSSYLKQLN